LFQFGLTSRFFFPRKQLVPKWPLSSTAWWSLLCNRLVFNEKMWCYIHLFIIGFDQMFFSQWKLFV
jgi:hypothetical protein